MLRQRKYSPLLVLAAADHAPALVGRPLPCAGLIGDGLPSFDRTLCDLGVCLCWDVCRRTAARAILDALQVHRRGSSPRPKPPQRVVQPRREYVGRDLRSLLKNELNHRKGGRHSLELIKPVAPYGPNFCQRVGRSLDLLVCEVSRIAGNYHGDGSWSVPALKFVEGFGQGERESSGSTLSIPLRFVPRPSLFVCVELQQQRILAVGSLLDFSFDVLDTEGATRIVEQPRLYRLRHEG